MHFQHIPKTVHFVCLYIHMCALAEEHVIYVKKEMQKRGYLCLEFASLPTSFRQGSRELLLAFAWLLFKEDIIGRLTRNRVSSVHSDLVSLFEVNAYLSL